MKYILKTYLEILIALSIGNLLLYSYDIVTNFNHNISHISKDGFLYVMASLPLAALILTPFYIYLFKHIEKHQRKEDST